MRLYLFVLAFFITTESLHADIVQVPLRADNTLDIDVVLSGFDLVFRNLEEGTQSRDFTGEILGEMFSGKVINLNALQDFTLAIEAPTLSDHANFLIAVLVTDVFCLINDLTPGVVLWKPDNQIDGATRAFPSSCGPPRD